MWLDTRKVPDFFLYSLLTQMHVILLEWQVFPFQLSTQLQ